MNTKLLNRQEYIDSAIKMNHFGSLKFAKNALDLWDDYYSWKNNPCLALYNDNDNRAICYLFYHISRDNEYLTIHYLLTPYKHRDHGYAKAILKVLFNDILHDQNISRVKLSSVASSIKFYLKLGIDFWGVNSIGQYYTDFPMPNTLNDIPNMMRDNHLKDLSAIKLNKIYDKLKSNGSLFENKELETFNKAIDLLQERYRFEELKQMIEDIKPELCSRNHEPSIHHCT